MDSATPRWRPPLGLGLLAVLTTAAALRLWRLSQNGYGNEYYTAGVRSMSLSWHNFFYNSFDPAGFVSIDKPPVALWIQVASVKLFGFHALAVLVPQALLGVAAVALLYYLVRRTFGGAAGLLSALFLAISPVSVAIDRSSNTDSCLVLVLLLAAWALTLAVENGSVLWLSVALGLIGLGFNVKMLAAFVVLPIFALVYLIGALSRWPRRIVDLALAGVVLAVVSASWILTYDLTPAERRPYAGTTNRNSMLELAVGPTGSAGSFGRPSSGARRPTRRARSIAPSRPAHAAVTPGSSCRRRRERCGSATASSPVRSPGCCRWPSPGSRSAPREIPPAVRRLRRACRCCYGPAGSSRTAWSTASPEASFTSTTSPRWRRPSRRWPVSAS